MKNLKDFRETRKKLTTEEFDELIGFDLGLEAEILFVYFDKYYIEYISEDEFEIDLCGYTARTNSLEEAELVLWNGFAESDLNDDDRDAINTISSIEFETRNPNIKY